MTALLSAGADGGARNAAGAMAVDLVPDDSALWSVLVPFRMAGSSGGAVPGAVRNLRVTRLTETPRPEWDDYREWTWTWTWDRPASDGDHPITEYRYDSAPCGRRVSPERRRLPHDESAIRRSFIHARRRVLGVRAPEDRRTRRRGGRLAVGRQRDGLRRVCGGERRRTVMRRRNPYRDGAVDGDGRRRRPRPDPRGQERAARSDHGKAGRVGLAPTITHPREPSGQRPRRDPQRHQA